MAYRVLLMGNNKTMIDDIFKYTEGEFEFQNTSSRFDDIKSHLKYFKPHILLYCMHNEIYDVMQRLVSIKHSAVRGKTFFGVVASVEDCAELRVRAVNVMDLEIEKPVTVPQIVAKLTSYLKRNLGNVSELTEQKIQMEAPQEQKKPEDTVNADAAFLQELDAMFAAEPSQMAMPSNPQPEAGQQMNQASKADVQFGAQQVNAKRKHILVVDDDFRMLKLIKRYLEDRYDIATAVNGKVALKFLQTKMTNLILLDYEMPEENGPAVLEKLRANPLTSNIPVIFLTGINDSKKIMQVLSLKPQGYLLKPIDHEKLLNEIKNVIG